MRIKVGYVIKHERFLDVAIHVHKVRQYSPKRIEVSGEWINQGFNTSFPIQMKAKIYIEPEKLSEWLYCTDKNQDPCLRKCPWERLDVPKQSS